MGPIAREYATLLAKARVILLDFDGPVCSVFAHHPAPMIAAELRQILVDQGVRLPGNIADEPDPMEVLRWTGRLGRIPLTRTIDHALTAAELTAVRSAEPTPYAREFIMAAHQAGSASPSSPTTPPTPAAPTSPASGCSNTSIRSSAGPLPTRPG